jgi:hypothetical protein
LAGACAASGEDASSAFTSVSAALFKKDMAASAALFKKDMANGGADVATAAGGVVWRVLLVPMATPSGD